MRPLVFLSLLGVTASLLACEDKRSTPSLGEMEREAKAKEDQRKAAEEARVKKEQVALESLSPQVAEKRRALEQKLSAVYDALPKDPTKLKREACPDAKLTADTPSVEGRKLLLVNQESLYRMAGKPEGGAQVFHTPAADDASSMVRPEGKETPLLARGTPATAADAQAILDAITWVTAHRYLGVAMFTRYRAPRTDGSGATPAHVEGMNVLFDKDTGKYLCQVEASADNLGGKTEALTVGKPLFEDLWAMYLLSSSKNLDAVTKELTVEGAPPRRK